MFNGNSSKHRLVATYDRFEKSARCPFQVRALGNVLHDGRARDEQRAAPAKILNDVDGPGGPQAWRSAAHWH